ncbi:Ger(x)C family spore germination protein [Paenibacillus sp. S28]|uniref:Ger(x)C family spore germination protein n=1 Tax=Paenibacillus sp. S28 TaxID=2767463 RepID=UPI00190D7463|nr:Ger(x)C family spore germination protein [Paenibacillus sp. S28]MBJ9987868.1 Ger(x)C family spore germination protein [Paenibacillus sp. S28]
MYFKFGIALLLILVLTTGCWDQKELSSRSIWIGSGFDRDGRGDIVLSGQILIPGKQGQTGGKGGSSGNGTSNFVVSGMGKNVSQAAADLQGSLSREVFPSHRRVVFLGEQFARDGVTDMLDEHSRNPLVRLRTDIFVVKDGTARELIQSTYPLEKIPAIGAYKELEHTSGMKQATFMRFLRAASSDGVSPVLPVISLNRKGNKIEDVTKQQSFRMNGIAIFDKKKLKLKGFISQEEALNVNWITGVLNSTTVTTPIPKNQGRVSIHLSRIGRRILPENHNGKIVFHVKLTGKGVIRENQTRLDLRSPTNVKLVKQALEVEAAKEIKEIILKMQNTYQEDIFGFGETLHRKSPSAWKKIKDNWNNYFTAAEFDVKAELTITQIGLTGPGLYLREEETIK